MVESADLTSATWAGPGPGSSSPLGEGLVTADIVAAYLAVDVSYVYRMAGKSLPVVVVGRAKRFRVADVVAFVENATRGGQALPVDRVKQLLAGAARGRAAARSNDLDASRGQSVHRDAKQEPWRPPGSPEDN